MKKNNFLRFFIVIALLLTGIFLFFMKDDFHNPFRSTDAIISPSFCTTDLNGNLYVIDHSAMRIVRADKNGKFTLAINSTGNTFDTARSLAVDEAGNIYVSDTRLDADGAFVENERILMYNSLGIFKKVLYSYSYAAGSAPKGQGLFTDLKYMDGSLYFVHPGSTALSIMKLSPVSEEAMCISSIPLENADRIVLDAELANDFSALYLSTKYGEIQKYPLTEAASTGAYTAGHAISIYKGHDKDDTGSWSIPWGIALDADQNLYFADIGTRQVLCIKPEQSPTVFLQGRYQTDPSLSLSSAPIFNRISVGADGTVATTDTFQAVFLDSDGSPLFDSNVFIYPAMIRIYYFVLWILFLAVCSAILILAGLLLSYFKKRRLSSMEKLSILIVVLSLLISGVVGRLLIEENNASINTEISQNVLSMTNMASSLVDGDLFQDFSSLADFQNPSYQKLKKTMDGIMELCYESGSSIYYVFYGTDQEQVYRIIDYSNTVGTIAPIDSAYHGSYYEEVMTSGKTEFFDAFQDSTGIWTLAVAPIYDTDGNIVAVIELGRNTIKQKLAEQSNVRDVILSILALVVVIILVLNEGVYFLDFIKNRPVYNKEGKKPLLPITVIRPLTFCLLMADFMQNAFEPIYVTRLYSQVMQLPENIVVPAALSAEVFSVSIFSVVAGRLRQKLKLKPMLYAGSCVAALGFALRGLAPDIPTFIIGKIVTGIGMGFVFVALNTFIAERNSPDEISHGFTAYYASYLAAINVGIVFGSTLAEKLNYKAVYFISAIMMILCTSLISFAVTGTLEPDVIKKKEEAKSSFFSFLFHKSILSFFLFMFIPYIIASYFLYYFYPLYANAAGLSDSKIGQTYLINGLCVIYIGPILAPFLLKKFGQRLTILFGGLLCVIGMLLFALEPSIPAALVCILLMGISDSFMFTAGTIYYNEQPAVKTYGISSATGVQSAVQNFGTTLAPFLFSSALLLGTASGISAIAISLAACFTGFALFSKNHTDINRKE